MKNYIHINLTLERTTKNSLSRAGFEVVGLLAQLVEGGLETRRCEFKSRSRERIFRCPLQCQINMNVVFSYDVICTAVMLSTAIT